MFETLAPGLRLAVSPEHRFGTDAFLLSDFAAPRAGDRACDLCSGCGIVPALWFREPERAPDCWALEVQGEAVRLMERSVAEGGLPGERFHPVRADLREPGALPAGSFDLVTCNPPYRAAGTGRASGTEAGRIARHETLCTLEQVCAAAARLLRFGGRFCLCHRPGRLPETFAALRARRLEPKRLRLVQQRGDRPPWLALVEGRLGGRPGLRVEPALLVEGGDGYSAEMLRIYRKKEETL